MRASVQRLRRTLIRWLHRATLALGFRLTRVKPFEADLRRFELDHDDFYFVQIGAHNGVTSDPFLTNVVSSPWHCLLVEPPPKQFSILESIYSNFERIVCCNTAIGATDSTVTMYSVREDIPDLPYWASQLASLRREVLLSHADQIPGLAELTVAQEIPSLTLPTLVARHAWPRIDLLAIDVEGYDFEIVKQIDGLPSLPSFIYYEHRHLSREDWRASLDFLARRGYVTHSVNEGDTFARLASRRSTPPKLPSGQ